MPFYSRMSFQGCLCTEADGDRVSLWGRRQASFLSSIIKMVSPSRAKVRQACVR